MNRQNAELAVLVVGVVGSWSFYCFIYSFSVIVKY